MTEKHCPNCEKVTPVGFHAENKISCLNCGRVYQTKKTRTCCKCKKKYITAAHDNVSTHCEDCNKTIYCMSCNADREYGIRDDNVVCSHCGHIANIKPESLGPKDRTAEFDHMREKLRQYDEINARIHLLQKWHEDAKKYPFHEQFLKAFETELEYQRSLIHDIC